LGAALAGLGAANPAFAAGPEFIGNWARDDGKTHIRVERCGADFCGVNTWVRPGHNAEKVGDTLVANLKPAGAERWSAHLSSQENSEEVMKGHEALAILSVLLHIAPQEGSTTIHTTSPGFGP
jgi:hypothetical protein